MNLKFSYKALALCTFFTTSTSAAFLAPNVQRRHHNCRSFSRTHHVLLSQSGDEEFLMPPVDQLVSDTPPEQRGIGVGIDLGTTNSCAAILTDGIPVIIPIPNNGRTMPSVASLTEDNVWLTGTDAVHNEIISPGSSYRNVKRIMGMGGTSAAVSAEVVPNLLVKTAAMRRKARSMSKKKSDSSAQPSLSAQLKDAEENPALLSCHISNSDSDETERITFTPEEISSKVLQILFKTVEEHKGTKEKITRAVVGVPAYFNDMQREATLRACKLAGVEKARLLREPEAAALAYGIGKEQAGSGDDEELVLVFDLGGGTFDVSILEVGGGIMEVLATSGNNMLGGSDFDARIGEFLSKLVAKGARAASKSNQGKNFWKNDGEVKDAIVRTSEAIRIYLTNNKVANLHLPLTEEGWLEIENSNEVIFNAASSENIDPSTHIVYELTRKEMENLCYDEFQALLRPVREVAILAQALLPGDARPNLVEAALRMEEEMDDAMNRGGKLSFDDFFTEDEDDASSTMAEESNSDIDPKILLQLQAQDLKSRKKEQQGGRKRARATAAKEKKFRSEKRKAEEESKFKDSYVSGKGGNVKVRDGIHGRPITQVVLVGGATRMPAIGRLLAAITGVIPQRTVNPDEAVALGCAVQVGILDGDAALRGLQVLSPMQAAVLRAMAKKKGMSVNT